MKQEDEGGTGAGREPMGGEGVVRVVVQLVGLVGTSVDHVRRRIAPSSHREAIICEMAEKGKNHQ
jgi:hypothetical protein